MSIYTATMIAEGVEPADSYDVYVEAWQTLIDTGVAWTLQGFFGRTAQMMIENGECHA